MHSHLKHLINIIKWFFNVLCLCKYTIQANVLWYIDLLKRLRNIFENKLNASTMCIIDTFHDSLGCDDTTVKSRGMKDGMKDHLNGKGWNIRNPIRSLTRDNSYMAASYWPQHHSSYDTALFEHWQRIQRSTSMFISRSQSSLLKPWKYSSINQEENVRPTRLELYEKQ